MERSVDKLARYIMYLAGAAAVITVCWYIRSVLIYMILAAVVSLIGQPVKNTLQRVSVKGRHAPDWLLALLTIGFMVLVVLGLITLVIPIVYNIVQNISQNMQQASLNSASLAVWLANVNEWAMETFPALGRDFKIQNEAVSFIVNTLNITSVTAAVGSGVSMLGSFGIGLFSVAFISFFFIKDDKLFGKIVGALVPDHLECRAMQAIDDIDYLLRRYFGGLVTEILAVTLMCFLGLFFIAKLGFAASIGIAFIAGLFNVIPYVGPWIGGGIGVGLGIVLKYSSAAAVGADMNIIVVLLILLGIFAVTQFIDNNLLQPLIFSASIKSSPLEIFIVLLIAGHIGGILGMLVAIPSYTVVKVIAAEFFSDVKAIGRLVGKTKQ